MAPVDKLMEHVEIFGGQDPFMSLKGELNEALSLYWSTASQILQGSGISVLEPPPEYFSLKRNFFSALFMYSYFRAGIPKPRRNITSPVSTMIMENLIVNSSAATLPMTKTKMPNTRTSKPILLSTRHAATKAELSSMG